MDTIWSFRQAYETARKIRDAQDAYCSSALSGNWAQIANQAFPEELQWEALVDVLRGRVKVHTHCYETVDLDAIVRVSLSVTKQEQVTDLAFGRSSRTSSSSPSRRSIMRTRPIWCLISSRRHMVRNSMPSQLQVSSNSC
jgi:hypothetical protein